MPYYTDTINDFVELKSDIESYLISNGWALVDGILSKDSYFLKLLSSSTSYLSLQGGLGQTGSTLTTPSPKVVCVKSIADDPMVFPITYHLFIFNDPIEVYCFIEYNSGYFQQISFGKSNLQGVGPTPWFTGSVNGSFNKNSIYVRFPNLNYESIYVSDNYTDTNILLGLFVDSYYNTSPSSYIYSNLDTVGWKSSYNGSTLIPSISNVAGLITALPNLSNNATVLLPIKVVMVRSSGGRTILANLVNARLLRIDNHESKDIITFGSEQWMVFPFYRRDVVNRNAGNPANHSGTFGFAIRYGV